MTRSDTAFDLIDGRLRVSFVLTSLGPGGAQRQLLLAAAGMRRRGHDARVFTMRGAAALDDRASELGVPVLNAGHDRRLGGVLGRLRLVRELRRWRPDAIYSFMPAANVTVALGRLFWPHTPVIWGIRDSGMEASTYGRKSQLTNWLADRSSRVPDVIVANSYAAQAAYVDRGYPTARFRVVPNGIDTEEFRPDPALRSIERALGGFEADEYVIACVGRVDPMKGHDVLLAAFAEAAGGAAARLWVVGTHSDEWRERYMDDAGRLGVADRVTVSGARFDLRAVYNAADLVVSASVFGEGFSNVVGEALSCGCQVVATDVGDSARILNGLGTAVAPGDAAALAAGIEHEMHDLDRRASGAERSEYVRRNFSVDQLVDRTIAVIEGAIGDRSR